MIVDVIYEGLPLCKAANAREEGAGAFIEMETPMPVGTRLSIRSPEGVREARVERVHEGVGPGVVVQFTDKQSLGDPGSERKASQVPQHSAAPAPEPDEPDPQSPQPDDDDKKGGARKERRGKSRKSAAQH